MAKFVVEGTPVGDGDTSGCCAYGCVVGVIVFVFGCFFIDKIIVWLWNL
jgi:hypothetical protein